MKKVLFLIVAIIITTLAPAAAQSPEVDSPISISYAMASVYNPITKTNL